MCVRSYSRYVLALHLQAGFKPASSIWSIEIYGQTLILHHHHCCCRCSLVPRPHLWGGNRVWWLWAKSLVQLTTHGGICTSQSDCSFSPVIWLASCRNVTGPLPTIRIWIAYSALLTNQIRVQNSGLSNDIGSSISCQPILFEQAISSLGLPLGWPYLPLQYLILLNYL